MYLKERRYEIAKQNIWIFTHIAFIPNDINPGDFIGGFTIADGVIAVAILAVGDTRIANINSWPVIAVNAGKNERRIALIFFGH